MKKLLTLTLIISVVSLSALCACSAKAYTEATYTPDEQITAVSIDVTDRKIVFSESTDGKLSINYYYNDAENYNFSVSEGQLFITRSDNKKWYDFFGSSGNREQRIITIYLPSNYLESLTVATTNFDIVLPQTTINGDCTLYSNGGNVYVESLFAGGTTNLSAKNGSVSGSVVGTYEKFILDITIKKGDSNLVSKTSGEKLLKVDVNNGDINLEFVNR